MLRLSLVLLFLGLALFVHSDGDDSEPAPWDQPDKVDYGGRFWVNLEKRDDIWQPDGYFVNVKVDPTLGEWPGVRFDKSSKALEGVIRTYVQIRGIDVPERLLADSAQWERHHLEVGRYRDRFDAGNAYVWNILSSNEKCWVENPRLQPGSRAVAVDFFVEIGGRIVNFGEALVEAGHATSGETKMDWGRRLVRPIE